MTKNSIYFLYFSILLFHYFYLHFHMFCDNFFIYFLINGLLKRKVQLRVMNAQAGEYKYSIKIQEPDNGKSDGVVRFELGNKFPSAWEFPNPITCLASHPFPNSQLVADLIPPKLKFDNVVVLLLSQIGKRLPISCDSAAA